MQNINRIELKRGVNNIVITSEDLGLMSAKRPIALLPSGHKLKAILFDTDQRFRSTGISNQENSDSCIKFHNMVGTNSDSQEYLAWTDDPADNFGRSTENTGSYFDDPVSVSHNTDIVLETWFSPKVWTMEANTTTSTRYTGQFGSQDAAVSAAGYNGVVYQYCEEWNNPTWSSTGSINSADMRGPGACGTQTAGLCHGGYVANVWCEEYNGSTWSVVGSLNVGRRYHIGTGTQTAGLTTGGNDGTQREEITEEYNGSSWTSASSLSIARSNLAGAGTQTSSIVCGGSPDTWTGDGYTESYDGVIWSAENNMLMDTQTQCGAGGSSSNILTASGQGRAQTTKLYATQEFDGTRSLGNNVNFSAYSMGCGTTERALKWGGNYATNQSIDKTESLSGVNMNEITISGKMRLTFLVT